MSKSLQEIVQIVKEATETIHANETFLLPMLARKATKAAEQYPFDHSLITASQVLNKMAETKLQISRTDLNGLYDQLQSTNSKLGDVFAEELDRGDLLKGSQYYNRAGEESTLEKDFESIADPVLSNALASAFDGTGSYKPYSVKLAKKAEASCNAGLLDIGLAPSKIDVFAGQEDIIICQATYETPKGQCNVLVPIEIKEGSVMLPNMFLGESAFIDLNQNMLKSHIIATAGKSFYADGEGLLKVLSSAKGGVKKVASDVEMAIIRMKSEKGEAAFDPNSVIGLKIAAEDPGVQDPQYEKSKEHFDFADRITSKEGAARFLFGDKIVDAGRDSVLRSLSGFGYKNVQVKVADCTDNEIRYAVATGASEGLLAPVKISGSTVHPPKIAIASGKVKEFSKAGIAELLEGTLPDTRVLSIASSSAGMKPSELVQQVRDAVNDGNYLKAEDAINVLGEVDPSAQKVAIAVMLRGVSGKDAYNGTELDEVAEKKVHDIPLFNTYNVFFPTEG